KAVSFLFHVGQLGVAETKQVRIVELGIHEALIADVELVQTFRSVAIAPTALRAPANAAEFTDHERHAQIFPPGIARTVAGGYRLAATTAKHILPSLTESLRVLVIVVVVTDLGVPKRMRPTAGFD